MPKLKERTNSERLIDALDKEAAKKKIQRVRLMHKVTETSLLAVSKAQKTAECENEKLGAALERAKVEGRDPDDIPDSEKQKFKKLTIGEILEVAAELSLDSHNQLLSCSCHNNHEAEAEELPFMLDIIDEKLAFVKNFMTVREQLALLSMQIFPTACNCVVRRLHSLFRFCSPRSPPLWSVRVSQESAP